ncbi:CLC_0170 family protein [Paenibacillus sp. FJAT-26967]|uniref:CLC_0170 family protein n=1 Tax=Paenibacillus sp. FJAT-26967 TaxID=1729690 RepID=UPI00083945EB|nr:CLC_0170 family protein [Paenibacillus sp. FJAT-26967]
MYLGYLHYLASFFLLAGLGLLLVEKRIYEISGWDKEKNWAGRLGWFEIFAGLLIFLMYFLFRHYFW